MYMHACVHACVHGHSSVHVHARMLLVMQVIHDIEMHKNYQRICGMPDLFIKIECQLVY